jgi:multiple sugar transport system ATP-binding protein
MASVELKNVSKVFQPKKNGEDIYAVTNLHLTIADKELLVLLGPSGCGKTTTLRLIAGLEQLTTGTISIGGIVMNEVRPEERDVAMVFQRDALYPHMTVFENVAFGLKLRRVPKAEVETRVRSMANALGIGSLLDRHPRALSGGQRQRVALARALVRNPKVLLLDEPLSNLDAPLRTQMRGEILRLHARAGTTMIHVTHDQAEAMILGQRIAIMRDGELQQIGTPLALYDEPANMFVAGFIGSPPMNLIRGRVVASGEEFVFRENNPAGATNGLRIEGSLPPERGRRLSHFAEGNIVLGIRAEHMSIREVGGSHVPVELVERLGADTHVHFNTGAHVIVARVNGGLPLVPGERAPLSFDMTRAMFFNPASGAPII